MIAAWPPLSGCRYYFPLLRRSEDLENGVPPPVIRR